MSNPVIVSCPVGEWTKVATGVLTVELKKLNTKPNKYLETYRDTTGTKPTDQGEGVPLFEGKSKDTLTYGASADVYVFAVGAAGKIGKVRVDT